jgi:hypothetical protein
MLILSWLDVLIGTKCCNQDGNKIILFVIEPNCQTVATVWQLGSITNRMILFPSWLQHFVPINTSNQDRISIAFNVMLKGTVGSSTDFQSAEF